jgi:hypothetical protein
MTKDASKPPRGSRKAGSIASSSLEVISGDPKSFEDLTPAEIKLIRAYRQCCDETQGTFSRAIAMCAENDLTRRPALKTPSLRLVSAGRPQ